MKTGVGEALLLVAVMSAAIFFCRIFPFLFFRGKSGGDVPPSLAGAVPQNRSSSSFQRKRAFLAFVEKTVPPVAMTVLALSALAVPVKADSREIIPILTAAAFTATVHIWRRNPLISIFGGTALYMILLRVLA
jgi:branched-subunit amino acid transport protein AzlD